MSEKHSYLVPRNLPLSSNPAGKRPKRLPRMIGRAVLSLLVLLLGSQFVWADEVGGEVFLRGNYLEVGIHAAGSFGSANPAPAGYHNINRPQLGFVTDPQRDGWDQGSPPQSGDYFLPGDPEEGWGVEWTVGGVEYNFNNFGRRDLFQVTRDSLVETSSGDTQSAVWRGTATNGSQQLAVMQTAYFDVNEAILNISVVLTNTGTVPLESVEYMRNIDPDNEWDLSDSYDTVNYVPFQPGVGDNPDKALVVARGPSMSNLVLSLFTVDSRARVSTEGFSNRDPDAILDSPVAPPESSPITADQAIVLAYRFGTLAPGESVAFDYAYVIALDPLLEIINAPMVDLNGADPGLDFSATFTEDLGAVAVASPDATVTDAEDTILASATVTLTNLLDIGEVLTATTGSTSIAASYTPATGVLSLTGTDTITNYQQVLRTVTYDNTSQDPDPTARIIEFVANDGEADGRAARTTLTVNPVNDAPVFTKGADQTVDEDAGPQHVPGWATDVSPGPTEESAQSLIGFTVTNDNGALFSAQPAVDTAGDLSYTPAADANGTAVVTVTLQDGGGTANGGVDTSVPQTFNITVDPVNDAPSFTGGADQAVDEDAGPQVVSGWATDMAAGPPNEASQVLTFVLTNHDNDLFAAQPGVDGTTGDLTYTPAADVNGSATVTVTLRDSGGTASGGVDMSAPQTFTITVNPVDDAPEFTSTPVKVAAEDQPYTYDVTATDVDVDPSLTITAPALPGWLALADHGDGTATLSGTPASAETGDHGVTLQVRDTTGLTGTQSFTITVGEKPIFYVYLPVTFEKYVVAPDLVVADLIATATDVRVVIENQGSRPVTDDFWVDVYIDPAPAPTTVNQTWDQLGSQGLVWGVTADALPLQPGDAITLTVGDAYFWPDYSQVSWPLSAGTPVYAQADSLNVATTYGAVLESHEVSGGTYNNIGRTVVSSAAVNESEAVGPAGTSGRRPAGPGDLPRRP